MPAVCFTISVTRRPTWIGTLSLVVALGAMAVDHLLGTEREEGESGLADPGAFAVSATLCLATAALLFRWLVPRMLRQGPERAARTGLVLSLASVVPGIAFWWLGFPLVVAGAGIALGLEALAGPSRIVAGTAVVLGALVLVGVSAYYVVAAVV